MAQNLNIVVCTTAAESSRSNGLNEQHNEILGEMVKKTLEDTHCSFEIALAWAISTKNTLHSVHRFSPNQLVFGRNPNLPSFLIDKLPALEGICTSEVVASNLMYAARKQFIMCESSEKLRRALRHQVRTSITQSYKNGDVFYKRNLCDRWLGPGTVIGWEHKQVLVKDGGTYVRVHPCRLVPHPEVYQNASESESMVEPTTSQVGPKETSNISIFGENNVEEQLGTLNDHVEQHQTVRNGQPKQNSNRKKIELPKPFWLDFEHGVREWKAYEIRPTSDDEHTFGDEENIMISSFDCDLETARENELQSWIKNKVYTQVSDQGQPRISTRWVYTHKNVNNKQVCKVRLVARGFQDRDAKNIRNDSL